MQGSQRILFGLRYCLIAVNLWDFHPITIHLKVGPWLIGQLFDFYSLHQHCIHFVIALLVYIALRQGAKNTPTIRKVLSCEKPKAEKSFGAKCRRHRKPYRAKCRTQGKSCRRNAEGKESPVSEMLKAKKVLSNKMPKARKVLLRIKPKARTEPLRAGKPKAL